MASQGGRGEKMRWFCSMGYTLIDAFTGVRWPDIRNYREPEHGIEQTREIVNCAYFTTRSKMSVTAGYPVCRYRGDRAAFRHCRDWCMSRSLASTGDHSRLRPARMALRTRAISAPKLRTAAAAAHRDRPRCVGCADPWLLKTLRADRAQPSHIHMPCIHIMHIHEHRDLVDCLQ